MAKKRKTAAAPELSKLDTTLYVLLEFLFGLAVPFSIVFLLLRVSDRLAESNPRILTWSTTGAQLLCVIPPLLLLGLTGFAAIGTLFTLNQPLFGRTDISYGYPYDASLYPLFRADRQSRPPASAALRRHKQLKKNAVLFIGLYIAVTAVSALGACPRYELETDHTLVYYNSFNEPVRQYGMTDFSDVSIETFFTRHGWSVEIFLGTSDGKTYRFATPHRCAKLADLIRTLPPVIVTVSGADRLPDVFARYKLTEAEEDALRELFGISDTYSS